MNQQTVDWILIFLIIILVGVISMGLFTVDKDSFQCLKNPVLYYEHMKDVSCICAEELPPMIFPKPLPPDIPFKE